MGPDGSYGTKSQQRHDEEGFEKRHGSVPLPVECLCVGQAAEMPECKLNENVKTGVDLCRALLEPERECFQSL